MKKIEAIAKGKKFTKNLLGITQRRINRTIEGALDDIERQKEKASINYEEYLLKLADDDIDYKYIINQMIDCKQTIMDAENTIDVINEIKNDLEKEIDD